jgi:hypothetical protein
MNTTANDLGPSAASLGAAAPPALVKALRRMLRPLVRLLVAHQITYPLFANLLKTVYVEVADSEFALPGRSQTISRVSLLTGVHRKDVKRLRGLGPEADAIPAAISLGAQLVARWAGLAEFQDADGHPLPLPRQADSGPSFERLVLSVSKDIRSRAVLDELLRLGVAEIEASEGEELVRLNSLAFVPERGFDEKAFRLGRNVRDHIATAAHNLAGTRPSLLERSVDCDDLTPDSVRELRELSQARAVEALQAVNRRALALQAADASQPDAKHRMNFGVYFSEGNQEAGESESTAGGVDQVEVG